MDKNPSALETYVNYCNCLKQNLTDLITIFTNLTSSYRLLVGSAEEFNRITLAHKGDLEDAIDRADDVGKIIDRLIDRIDDVVKLYLSVCRQGVLCPDLKIKPCPEPPAKSSPFLEIEMEHTLEPDAVQSIDEDKKKQD